MNNFDLTLAKSFTLGDAARQLELRFEIFNVFNTLNVTGVNSTYGSDPANPRSSFLSPTRVANPRQFQAAIRFRF